MRCSGLEAVTTQKHRTMELTSRIPLQDQSSRTRKSHMQLFWLLLLLLPLSLLLLMLLIFRYLGLVGGR